MTISEIKQSFFAFRNGIVADTLRRAGMPYKVIFGLNLPQLSQIARKVLDELKPGDRKTLAEILWNDRGVRESRLLACWIYDPLEMSIDEAELLMNDVQTREEADILAFRLLRQLPFAQELANKNIDSYCQEALRRNLEA